MDKVKRRSGDWFLFVECGYYALLVYAMAAEAIGIQIRFFGPGMVLLLGTVCLLRLGPQALIQNKSIAYPLGCATSFVLIQALIHGESFGQDIFKNMVSWIPGLIILNALFLRKGFFVRFSVVAALIGLAFLPLLSNVTPEGDYERLGLEPGVGLSNPNGLAAWFGFCGVVFYVIGLETRIVLIRAISWAFVLVCMYVIGLTISRTSLLAFVLSATVASRHLLKRGLFLAIILLCIGSWIAYESGVFDNIIANYTIRSTEETGRFQIWPLALDRFLQFPLTGVGISEQKIPTPPHGTLRTPHNGFLSLALISGVVPLGFFVAYWIRAGLGAWKTPLRAKKHRMTDASFRLPLFIFAFLINFGTNTAYMDPWMMLVLTMLTSEGVPHATRLLRRSKPKTLKHRSP